jgi:PPOX class probable F420-dependent enzyme
MSLMAHRTERPDPSLARLARLRRGVLTTLKRDGRPQLSVVSYHCDPSSGLVRISTRDPLAKTANARRDPRVSLFATTRQMWPYVVAEGDAEVGPVAQRRDDAVVEELVEHYRAINGEHPDWDEFRQAMVDEQRLILRFTVTRTYGTVAG